MASAFRMGRALRGARDSKRWHSIVMKAVAAIDSVLANTARVIQCIRPVLRRQRRSKGIGRCQLAVLRFGSVCKIAFIVVTVTVRVVIRKRLA